MLGPICENDYICKKNYIAWEVCDELENSSTFSQGVGVLNALCGKMGAENSVL